jgi:rfaE bifunctional protein kinase chain/domain
MLLQETVHVTMTSDRETIHDSISRARLVELLERCRSARVAVVGDLGLDINWYIDMTRSALSRETPHFVRPVVREEFSLGAAGNVVANLSALGVEAIHVCGVIGDDWRGVLLRQELARLNVDTSTLAVSADRSTTAFARPVLMGHQSRQEGARLDFDNLGTVNDEMARSVVDGLGGMLDRMDTVLVADYLDSGLFSDRTLAYLGDLAESFPAVRFIADSRRRIKAFGSMMLKPNRFEAAAAVETQSGAALKVAGDLSALSAAAEELNRITCRPVFVTLDEDGALLCDGGRVTHVRAAHQPPPTNSVGAGDTFSASIGALLAAGASLLEAGAVGNLAASVVVRKMETTGTASPEEILHRYDSSS